MDANIFKTTCFCGSYFIIIIILITEILILFEINIGLYNFPSNINEDVIALMKLLLLLLVNCCASAAGLVAVGSAHK
jgi:hypothetical protein